MSRNLGITATSRKKNIVNRSSDIKKPYAPTLKRSTEKNSLPRSLQSTTQYPGNNNKSSTTRSWQAKFHQYLHGSGYLREQTMYDFLQTTSQMYRLLKRTSSNENKKLNASNICAEAPASATLRTVLYRCKNNVAIAVISGKIIRRKET
jgi:hypothetical protein